MRDSAFVANSTLAAEIFPGIRASTLEFQFGTVFHVTRDTGVLDYVHTEKDRRVSQPSDEFGGMKRAAGNIIYDAQIARILPSYRGIRAPPLRPTSHAPLNWSSQNSASRLPEASPNFSKIFLTPARTSPSPGRSPAADSASAIPPVRPLAPAPIRPALDQSDRIARREKAQRRRSSEAGETAANHCEIYFGQYRLPGG